jgi:hypothetical protein
MTPETLQLGELTFKIGRSARRRTVGITVERGGELILHAPEDFPTDRLERWAKGKLLWVYRKLSLKEKVEPLASTPEFVNGEGFNYLGRSYRLKLVEEQDQALRLQGGRFLLQKNARSHALQVFRSWFISAGAEWLRKRIPMLARKAGTMPSQIEVRDLGFRWGSSSERGILFFNWKLMQLPIRLVDYVILHELIHLIEPHHGTPFWKRLERALPDWRERKEELRTTAKNFVQFPA